MKTTSVCLALIFILTGIILGEERKIAEIKRSSVKTEITGDPQFQILYPEGYDPDNLDLNQKRPFFPDDPCTARMVGSSYWAVDNWLAGDELYKVYQDIDLLANDCTYPFYVTAVAIQLQTLYSGTLYLQADIEALDVTSTDACPFPGEILGMSGEESYEIPDAGNYLLVVVFDEPILVDTAYFAGMYFGAGASDLGPSLVTDNDPYLCVSWNDWGQGWADLISNPYFNFPGNLVMFSYGYNADDPSPSSGPAMIYSPRDSSTVGANVDLYAADLIDTVSYDKCRFEYYGPSGWTLIGEDTSPDITLRNSSTATTTQPGYYQSWNTSGLVEDWHPVRAIFYSAGSEVSGDTIDVYVDSTPLEPEIQNPALYDNVCDTITLKANVVDEDATIVQFELRTMSDTTSMNWPLLDQFDYGDVDGNPGDGNSYADGEYGDFYNGPTILTSMFKYFADQGYSDIMMIDSDSKSVDDMVEACADSINVRDRFGSEDDNFISHVERHIEAQGRQFRVETVSSIDPEWIIYATAYRKGLVLLGITDPMGYWLGLSEFVLPDDQSDSIECRVYDTRNAAYLQSVLSLSPSPKIEYNGSMCAIDRAIAVYPRADTTYRIIIGGDYNPSDGFSYFWDASSRPKGPYMLAAVAIDAANHVSESICAFRLKCESDYLPGDANASGALDIDDIIYLIGYIFQGGPAPNPIETGDNNCSDAVDVDDIVYLIAYIFQGGPSPCVD